MGQSTAQSRRVILILLLACVFAGHTVYLALDNDQFPLTARSVMPAGQTWWFAVDGDNTVVERGERNAPDHAYDFNVVHVHIATGRWTSGWWAATKNNVGLNIAYDVDPPSWWDLSIVHSEVSRIVDENNVLVGDMAVFFPVQDLADSYPWRILRSVSHRMEGYAHNILSLMLIILIVVQLRNHIINKGVTS